MGLDEALLDSGPAEPTLRFYTWSPPALSLGWFQRWADLEAIAGAEPAVRRSTGGGAIRHELELTFSIAAPLDHPLYRGSVAESYARVHGAIAAALATLGIDARLRGSDPAASDREGSPMCFHRSSALDLCWDGRKGLGSAQRRRGGRVLHHGSLKLGAPALEPGVATVRVHAPEADAPAVAELVREAFAAAFGARIEAAEPTAGERARARELARELDSPERLRRR